MAEKRREEGEDRKRESCMTKRRVLRMLEQQRGEVISGAKIASDLCISRAAVWKAIEELRGEGYHIEAKTNRGYALSEKSDLLSAEGISARLRHREFSNLVYFYDVLESTNLTAKQMAVTGTPHGTMIVAGEQTKGRGRLGRDFHSPKDAGIYFSIVLQPALLGIKDLSDAVLITAATSVAAARAIGQVSGQEVQIKWVNDLYLEDKKICGILTEGVAGFESGVVESIVVGILKKSYMPEGGFPREIKATAGALIFQGSKDVVPFTKNALIAAIFDCLIDILSEEWEKKEFIEEYRRRSYVLGKKIFFFSSTLGLQYGKASLEGRVEAKAIDIDDRGGLIVEVPDGTQHTLSSGEISVRVVE